mmetsp:Transcript_16525/g.35967  ORF Transcript_16525/g.35967 Transcript_16525/m.35967 type:complete len:671 (+) Transcript_16525:191-2203(+)
MRLGGRPSSAILSSLLAISGRGGRPASTGTRRSTGTSSIGRRMCIRNAGIGISSSSRASPPPAHFSFGPSSSTLAAAAFLTGATPTSGQRRDSSVVSIQRMSTSLHAGTKRSRTSMSAMDFVEATACSRCRGEGSVRARPSKKARAQRKRDLEAAKRNQDGDDCTSSLPPPAPPRYVPCPNCGGSGIVPLDSDATTSRIPTVHPGVRVAIVGGGIGGLALALALQHRSVPCIVYERDANFDERSQGYGLTMQQAARAVKALGLSGLEQRSSSTKNADGNSDDGMPTTKKFGITSRRHIVHKTDGTVVGQWGLRIWGRPDTKTKKEAGRQNAHIARQELRRMLLERLEPGTVKWSHKLVSFDERTDNGEKDAVHLTLLHNGETITSTSTVLVGADGIRSAVRRLKVGDICPLRYLDCIVILGIAPIPSGSYELADGETVFQTADGTTRIYAMPFSEAGRETAGAADEEKQRGRGEMMWQLSFPMDEADAQRLSNEGPAALKAEALARCGEWHVPIPELLKSTPDRLISGYPVYDRELLSADDLRHGDSRKEERKGESSMVTLIGDAAHPMSPFKGQGANQALLDAVLLARGLYRAFQQECTSSKNIPSIQEILSLFEKEMLSRSAAKVKASADAAKFLHSDVAVAEGNHPRCTAAANLASQEDSKRGIVEE